MKQHTARIRERSSRPTMILPRLLTCLLIFTAVDSRGAREFIEPRGAERAESRAEAKARLAEEAQIVKAAAEQRQRDAAEFKAATERYQKLPPEQVIAKLREAGASRSPANAALVALVGTIIVYHYGDKILDAVDDKVVSLAKDAKKALDEHSAKVAKYNAVIREKMIREGVFRDRQRYQAEMNESGKWSKLHPDRQNEILAVKFPDKK